MKVSVEEREGLFRALKVEVEGGIVKSALDEVYSYLKQNAEVEGFRKGKAPIWIIRAKFKDYIEEEVGKKVANATLVGAIKESGLTPVADVYLENVQLEELSQKLSYTISFEVPPQFELQNLEALEVEIQKVELNDDTVKERIEKLREEHVVWEPVEREIKEGDLAVLEYKVEDLDSSESTEGEQSAVVGSGLLREEVDRALLGKKEGEELSFEELTLYDMEGKPAGKARLNVKVKAVKEKILPEVSDDFAKELGLGETWEEAEEKIREELKEELGQIKRQMIYSAVSSRLVQMHDFALPQTAFRRELRVVMEERVKALSQMGIDPAQLDYRALAEKSTPQAVFRAKLRFILDRYAQEKDIQVSPEDVQKKIEELSQTYNRTPEEMKEFLQRENLMPVLEGDIKREKALEDIVSRVVIKEVEKTEEEKNENT